MSAGPIDAETVKAAIIAAFPRIVYTGMVTPADDEPWAEELDEDFDLKENLKGKSWDQIPSAVIDRNSLGLSLLTPEAFGVFLPAWIVRAVDMRDSNEDLGDFVVYDFSLPCREGEPLAHWQRAFRLERSRQLNEVQRASVRMFLEFWLDRGSSHSCDDVLAALQYLNEFESA